MSARIIEVIEVVSTIGQGLPHDPTRRVTEYFARDGTFLAVNDTCAPVPPNPGDRRMEEQLTALVEKELMERPVGDRPDSGKIYDKDDL
jgi:hypothetical protein